MKARSKNKIEAKLLGFSLIDRLLSTIFGLFSYLYVDICLCLSGPKQEFTRHINADRLLLL